ncbi:tRNA lysidine(34) synthetase TilS [Aminipila butyrica]|uniref:tRNA(Ile)-lysidine synthase n=1 Tax=Aminipila butyrica TaxID=433296 RepID=A0A858BXX3_9FIRM|nr:tRNA lysidine(34) synthetase TilS [Aminipila butyrica]QIB70292.1 tRNA lysidine(34) synthetase TilS [Aminipila butyrica]
MIENKIRKTILDKNLIEKGQHIILGLSGGPDSVCLFHVLMSLREDLEFTLSVVHVNHKFRPGEAEEDQAYVEDLCRRQGIVCESFVHDCQAIAEEKGISGEEAGRLVRYGSFYAVAKQLIDNKRYEPSQIGIAVAHNLNDQAETLLMRIIRGTGTDGLAGIEYSRAGELGTRIIRPLLDVARGEIEAYCQEHQLEPRVDRTNSQPVYTRNKIRLQVIPLLEREFNSQLVEGLNRLSKIAKDDKAYFDLQVTEAMEQAAVVAAGSNQGRANQIQSGQEGDQEIQAISFSLTHLQEMHPAIRHRVVKKAFETIGLDQGITAAHLEAVDRIIGGGSDSASADFPKGYGAAVSYGEVRFFKNDPITLGYVSKAELKSRLRIRIVKNEGSLKDISKNGTRRFAALDLSKLLEKIWSGDTPYFDRIEASPKQEEAEKDFQQKLIEEIQIMLQVRTRRQGDWIAPLGMKGRKKLQDIFVDEKVYKECRDQVPMVCIGDEVIWIVGDDVSGHTTGMKRGRMSENYKLDRDTKDIVLLEYLEKL